MHTQPRAEHADIQEYVCIKVFMYMHVMEYFKNVFVPGIGDW